MKREDLVFVVYVIIIIVTILTISSYILEPNASRPETKRISQK